MHMFNAPCSIYVKSAIKSAITFFCNMRAEIKPPALTEDVYQSCWHDFLICGPTIQPLTLKLKARPAKCPRQVNINHVVQLDTCFKSIIVHTPQCAIQHGMVVKALSVSSVVPGKYCRAPHQTRTSSTMWLSKCSNLQRFLEHCKTTTYPT